MGLFSRKKSGQNARPVSRASSSSEAQAAELRGRARRRLIGALALVLAAVIVVPMMFDDPAVSEQPETPVVLPALVPPVTESDLALAPAQPGVQVDEPGLADAAVPGPGHETVTDAVQGDVVQTPSQPDPAQPAAPQSATEPPESERPAGNSAESKPEPKAQPSTAPAKPQTSKSDRRTDDGSVALALLEGRAPPSSGSTTAAAQTPAPAQGSFVLQIAAYSTEADAQARRNRLNEAGVTNAYVEKGVSNDKTTYRLRVGSFPTRDAAQAAQARLRALGYDNSMLLAR